MRTVPVRLLIAIFAIGTTFGTGLAHGFKQATDSPAPSHSRSVPQGKSQNLGRAEYERLQLGMTQTQVESILDRGVEVERSIDTATYTWTNFDGSSITTIFKSDKLVKKTQRHLL
jgi:hypothetical protein